MQIGTFHLSWTLIDITTLLIIIFFSVLEENLYDIQTAWIQDQAPQKWGLIFDSKLFDTRILILKKVCKT